MCRVLDESSPRTAHTDLGVCRTEYGICLCAHRRTARAETRASSRDRDGDARGRVVVARVVVVADDARDVVDARDATTRDDAA